MRRPAPPDAIPPTLPAFGLAMSHADTIRQAIQTMLDQLGDGWQVAQHVIAMSLERVSPDGTIETTAWYWSPPGQPDWMTTGLLDAAVELDVDANHDTDT